MAAVCSRAESMRTAGDANAAAARSLADTFCLQARLRVDDLFRALWANTDDEDREVGHRVLAGDFAWVEAGVVDLSEGTGPWIATWEFGPSKRENVRPSRNRIGSASTTTSPGLGVGLAARADRSDSRVRHRSRQARA